MLEPAALLELPAPPSGGPSPLVLDEPEQAIDDAARLRKKTFRNCVARARTIEAPCWVIGPSGVLGFGSCAPHSARSECRALLLTRPN